jgi:Ser/Thr protein kinase RdoA (MazF antagonist)
VTKRGTTHDVRIDQSNRTVTKRFLSWDRNEPLREWTALTLLAEFAPGLAPAPISADLDSGSPALVMSWLPGTELGTAPLTPAQTRALAGALERLWQSAPAIKAKFPPAIRPNPVAFTGQVRQMVAAGPLLGDDPGVACACATAIAWLERGTLEHHSRRAGGDAVLGQGDPNLANFLWDDNRICLVDFEDCGPSDRCFELAILTEHLSAWSDAGLDADDFLALFGLTSAEETRVRDYRRLAALFWLIMLRPGSSSNRRNPPGTLHREAQRLLGLLG